MPFRPRRFVSLFVLTLVVLTSSAGCGRESEEHFPFAYVQDDCEAGKYEEPFLDISINENLPKSAPQDYSIRSGSSAVLASRCLTRGQCVGATSGTLHLTKFDKSRGISGEYKLRFTDGSVEKGRFDATRYLVPLLCG
jgi:hypothetical protein